MSFPQFQIEQNGSISSKVELTGSSGPPPPLPPSAGQSLSANGNPAGSSRNRVSGGPSALFSYSPATEELLARMRQRPGWDGAREHILSSIITSDKLPVLPPTKAGRGRGRPRRSDTGQSGSAGSPAMTSNPGSGRRGRPRGGGGSGGGSGGSSSARGRGSGRGGWRGGKRKREESEESDEAEPENLSDESGVEGGGRAADDSDAEDDYTPLPMKTKSGRAVHRPSQYVPTITSPASGHKKKRPYRRNPESAVCKACERGHSPANNAIVFCDGCGSAYHQMCHDPPIEDEVVLVAEKEWLCASCVKNKEATELPSFESLVSGQHLTAEEKRQGLSRFPQTYLVDLMLHVISLHVDLPVFPPSLAATNKSSEQNPTNDTNQQQQHTNDQADADSNAEAHYDGYETDPPQHYPKAGNGLARTQRPEADDLPWLIDDNFEVFSHQVSYPSDTVDANSAGAMAAANGAVPMPGDAIAIAVASAIPPHAAAAVGLSLITATGAPSPAANIPAVADTSMTGV